MKRCHTLSICFPCCLGEKFGQKRQNFVAIRTCGTTRTAGAGDGAGAARTTATLATTGAPPATTAASASTGLTVITIVTTRRFDASTPAEQLVYLGVAVRQWNAWWTA
jgi:hypothetical protein